VADESKGSSDAMNSLGSALTSPAKLAFAEFVILVYKGAIPGLLLCTFLIVAAVFFAVQTFHDDFLRIVLNRWAFAIAATHNWNRSEAPRRFHGIMTSVCPERIKSVTACGGQNAIQQPAQGPSR
jgi:hypothetical protein